LQQVKDTFVVSWVYLPLYNVSCSLYSIYPVFL
jgi:hypothetical protein